MISSYNLKNINYRSQLRNGQCEELLSGDAVHTGDAVHSALKIANSRIDFRLRRYFRAIRSTIEHNFIRENDYKLCIIMIFKLELCFWKHDKVSPLRDVY